MLTQLTDVRDRHQLSIEAGTQIPRRPRLRSDRHQNGTDRRARHFWSDPIVFTSSALPSERSAGDWGGVVLLGKARLSWGDTACDGEAGECVGSIEGIAPGKPRGTFGGNDDTHDCGTLTVRANRVRRIQVRRRQRAQRPDVGGCGDQTELSYIQIHRGLDDGVEFFGGTAQIDHVIVTAPATTASTGTRASAAPSTTSSFTTSRRQLRVPNGIEADNYSRDNNVQPRSAPQVRNGTVIGDGRVEGSGVVTRVGTWAILDGLVVVGFGGAGYDMRDGAWSLAGGWPDGIVVENSCFDDNGENYPVDDNDPKDDSVAGGADFFDEPTLWPMRRNNFEEDPELGDFSRAATGGSPEPDYGLSNANCPAPLRALGRRLDRRLDRVPRRCSRQLDPAAALRSAASKRDRRFPSGAAVSF